VASFAREDGTTVATTANPLAMSRTPVSYRLPPPRLGEHDDEIRAWLSGEAADG
jgi:crotonobetainyl-CoA:carnitine CoA-transferase CaiB-like acyl-CoA transferase